MVIYLIQDSGNKNFSSLLNMSNNIVIINTRDCPLVGGIESHVDNIREKLKHFDPAKDCMVLVGDPVNIGLSVHEMMKKGGGTVLKWDRQTSAYYPIKLKEN